MIFFVLALILIIGVTLLVYGMRTLYHAIWDACAYLKERKELKWM